MERVLITGASSGIGFATAKRFLLEGYSVIAQYNTNEEGINDLVQFANSKNLGLNLFIYNADFSKSDGVKAFINEIGKSFKSIDVLVNNAGIGLYELFNNISEADYDKIFNVNVKAPFLITQALSKQMISARQGKIIFISSIWGEVGASMETAYSASKSALLGLTKALAKELGPSNIRVNCICPGVIDTPMNSRFSEQDMLELISSTPMSRLGTAEDVANLVYFLAGEQSSFMTGQVIRLDGGFTL